MIQRIGFLDLGIRLVSARFAPTTARIPFLEPEFICQALDCRHGRVLLDVIWDTSAGLGLAVWDPITGDRTLLPKPDGRRFRSHYGAVLCAAADCDHRDCRGKPFIVVVFVGDTASGVASAWAGVLVRGCRVERAGLRADW
jgi:hypothetical protein